MSKNAFRYLIDVSLFVNLCTIAATGFILAVILPHGHGGRSFLGLCRHQWGDIHGNLALLLLLFLGLHVYLNWSWVRSTSARLLGKCWPRTLVVISMAWVGVLFVCWLLAMIFM